MKWISIKTETPKKEERVLVYSPLYEEMRNSHEMTYRIMAGQFVRICTDVTHWMRIKPPI